MDDSHLQQSDASNHGRKRVLGPYELLTELGKGAGGTVFLARHPELDRMFAVKVLPGGPDKEAETRFRREARLASRMTHPGLVPCLEVGTDARRRLTYLVMEYVPGQTLKQRLQAEGPLAPAHAAELVAGLAEAMASAHALEVVHRDLKPANILIDGRTGAARVADFGLAYDLTASRVLTRTGDLIGTPYYMAPEQMRGERGDALCDIYALGVILYELLTGERPFQGHNMVVLGRAILAGNPTPPSELRPEIPAALEAVCLQAMATEPPKRHSDAAALARALRKVAATSKQTPPAARAGDRATLPLAVLSTLLLSAVVALWVTRGPRDEAPAPEPSVERPAPEVANQDDLSVQARIDQLEEALAQSRRSEEGALEELRALGRERAGASPRLGRGLEHLARRQSSSHVLRAELHWAQGHFSDAMAQLQGADDDDLEALVLEHRVSMLRPARGELERIAATLRARAPAGSPFLAYADDFQLLASGREGVRRLLSPPWPDDPHRLWLRIRAADVAQARDELITLSRRYLDLNPLDGMAQLLMARDLYFRWRVDQRPEDMRRALEAVEIAREVSEFPTSACLNAGISHLGLGRPRLALIELEEALAQRGPASERTRARLWSGNALAYLGREAEAVQAWEEALRDGSPPTELAEYLALVSSAAAARTRAASRAPIPPPAFEVRRPR